MDLLEALSIAAPGQGRTQVVALVGAGGKTTALFAIASQARKAGYAVILTTTTAIRDPRIEGQRSFDAFIYEEELEGANLPPSSITIVAASDREGDKISGPLPERIDAMTGQADLILVEADGAHGLAIKAPGAHEPVIPSTAIIVIGCLGLDALGKRADPTVVHRLAEFLRLTGLHEGDEIGVASLARLVEAPLGLFKGTAPGARRVLLLSKADLLSQGAASEVEAELRNRALPVDLILLSSWGEVTAYAS